MSRLKVTTAFLAAALGVAAPAVAVAQNIPFSSWPQNSIIRQQIWTGFVLTRNAWPQPRGSFDTCNGLGVNVWGGCDPMGFAPFAPQTPSPYILQPFLGYPTLDDD